MTSVENFDDLLMAEYEAERKGTDRTLRINGDGYGTSINKNFLEELQVLGADVYNAAKGMGGDIQDEFITPAQRGIVKLFENATMPLAVSKYSAPRTIGRMLGFNDKNAVSRYANFYDNEVYPRIDALAERYGNEGVPSTIAGSFVEPITQYATPGIGYYNALSKLLAVKGTQHFISRAIQKFNINMGTEIGVVATAQDPEEGNFATAISELLGMEKKDTDEPIKLLFDYIASPVDQTTAETFFESKAKAMLADSPVAIGIATAVGFLARFGQLARITNANNPRLKERLAAGGLVSTVGPSQPQPRGNDFMEKPTTEENNDMLGSQNE